MVFNILTIFPHIFDSYFKETIIKRAQNRGLISIRIFDIREFTTDKHRTVDDKPYGGGPGMILKIEPIYNCLSKIIQEDKKKKRKIVLLSPKGKIFNQEIAKQLLNLQEITLICGRYEGVDERVAQYIADLEISIGNYILSGGELAAMIIVDTITRLVPGVIDSESLIQESFCQNNKKNFNFLEYPQYTKPEIFHNFNCKIFNKNSQEKEWSVPAVLLSGNHQKIREWKEEKKEFRK